MEVRRRTKIKAASKFKIEEVLAEVLKKEMFIASGKKFRYIDDWDTVMNSIYELPVEYDGYTKRVSEMNSLKEIINTLERNDFNEVKRSESRRKQMQQFKRTMSMHYNIIFTQKNSKLGFGALIHFPELNPKQAERSSGIVLMARCIVSGGKMEITFEKARFDDFLIEVKPYIELLGDMYRTHKP